MRLRRSLPGLGSRLYRRLTSYSYKVHHRQIWVAFVTCYVVRLDLGLGSVVGVVSILVVELFVPTNLAYSRHLLVVVRIGYVG